MIRARLVLAVVLASLACGGITENPPFQFATGPSISVNGDLEIRVGFRIVEIRGRIPLPCPEYDAEETHSASNTNLELTVRAIAHTGCAGAAAELRYSATYSALSAGTYGVTVRHRLDDSPATTAADTSVTVP